MVASAIAYVLAGIFGTIGLIGMGFTVSYAIRKADKFALSFFTAALFLALAWLCAHLGGI
jgi:uncharacterized membrane protein (Fun14 family)